MIFRICPCVLVLMLAVTAISSVESFSSVGFTVPKAPRSPLQTKKLRATRRSSLERIALPVVVSSLFPLQLPVQSNAETLASLTRNYRSSPSSPVVVIGAGGRVGSKIVRRLLKLGLNVKAVTLDGRDLGLGQLTGRYITSPQKLEYAVGDTRDLAQMNDVVYNASAVIFCASASKRGGDAKSVDFLGVSNVASACVSNTIPKLVLVSSGGVTRPDSAGFRVTNMFGRIMDYKLLGENELRQIYSSNPSAKVLNYVIIRPGSYSEEPASAKSLLISQGDIATGEISREDVAFVTVTALLSQKVNRATIEVFGNRGGGVKMLTSLKSRDDARKEFVQEVKKEGDYGNFFDKGVIYTDVEMAKMDVVSSYEPKP